MSKNPAVLYKTLVVGVIVLFVGLGVQPAFAVKSDVSDSRDDCNLCPKKVSNQNLVRLKNVVSRLETLNSKLSVLSKQYPEMEGLYIELSDIILTLKEINKTTELNSPNSDFTIICEIFYRIANGAESLAQRFEGLWEFLNNPYRPIRYFIARIMGWVVYGTLAGFVLLGAGFGCWEIWPE